MLAASLRAERDTLVAREALRGAAFGAALAEVLDRALGGLLDELQPAAPVAVVALGSYARRELCPASDVDVLLLSTESRRGRSRLDVRKLAERLWYPLWDAGFVTGHAARTVKQTVALADADLDALTAALEPRHVAGDESLTDDLARRIRQLAERRSERLLRALGAASEVRHVQPGAVAEMLEPDLKEGAGGLRDLQSLEWAGHTLGAPGGVTALVARGYLVADDVARLVTARDRLLDLRVALHRVTGARSDRLALQEQDAVAAVVGAEDADALVRELAAGAREVAWIVRDTFGRLLDTVVGPSGRVVHRDRAIARDVVLRDGRVTITTAGAPDALSVLEAGVAAAEQGAPFDRATLRRLREMSEPGWDVWERAAFLRLLRTGSAAVPVFEALDHEGVLTRLLPEWEHVRSRPQRNAYHRFTVDRHLLEAVAECARLLDLADAPERTFDGVVARACRRPELLLLAALLHDIGKGRPGDHSHAGAATAGEVARRMELDSEGREILVWLVRHHLVMADLATRRDLADPSVVDGLVEQGAGDAERLRLLYLLTIGDSLATGPAAWSASKAALVRELFTKAAAAVERGAAVALAEDRRAALSERLGAGAADEFLAVMPPSYVLAFHEDVMTGHRALLDRRELAVVCVPESAGLVEVTLVAPDRTGLLATVAGALTACGLAVQEAQLFSTSDGMALDVFRAADPFGRVADRGTAVVEETLRAALAGELDVEERVRERMRLYPGRGGRGEVRVEIDLDASPTSTVVEVHADDEVGLLYRIATTFAALGLDVSLAKVATLGERVVDVFYVRDGEGKKLEDRAALDRLRAALAERL